MRATVATLWVIAAAALSTTCLVYEESQVCTTDLVENTQQHGQESDMDSQRLRKHYAEL